MARVKEYFIYCDESSGNMEVKHFPSSDIRACILFAEEKFQSHIYSSMLTELFLQFGFICHLARGAGEYHVHPMRGDATMIRGDVKKVRFLLNM